MSLSQEQKDLLVGTLLGDGNLQTNTKGRTWRYRALHKADHFEYLQHKYEVMKSFCSSEPIYSKINDNRTGKVNERWNFNTTVHESFKHYGNLFYSYDEEKDLMVKDVPLSIEKLLSPRSVAYWYMDDGALKWLGKSNAMRICTESLSDLGVQRLQKALKNLYDIETQLTRKTNKKVYVGCRLAINEANSQKFVTLIRPYLINCMRYKVSDGNRGHL